MVHGYDPFDLDRFVSAQENAYEAALRELRAGHKRGHWMWFIFPQLRGLGSSSMAERYAIRSREEAAAYLAHPVLGPRLVSCAGAALEAPGSVREIFGYPDDLKLRSSATLFATVAGPQSVFQRLLERFFDGRPDERSLALVSHTPEP